MSGLRKRTITVLLITGTVLAVSAAVVYAGNQGGDHPKAASKHHGAKHHGHHAGKHAFPPSVTRFDLSGYVLETKYTLGRNTGNTFQQTYTGATVKGVPVEGPFVGQDFPPVDYVALPVAHKTLYVAWLDPSTHAIVDAFVMNFKTGVVFDYAPGSTTPESSGTVRILTKGASRIP
jgi:hypothetical protein